MILMKLYKVFCSIVRLSHEEMICLDSFFGVLCFVVICLDSFAFLEYIFVLYTVTTFNILLFVIKLDARETATNLQTLFFS